MKYLRILFLPLIALMIGCLKNENVDNLDLFDQKNYSGSIEIELLELEFESIELDSIPSSYTGFMMVDYQERLLFFDERFARFFEFDKNGRLRSSHMGIGGGPNEIPYRGLGFLGVRPDSAIVLVGGANDYYLITNEFERVFSNIIKWKQDRPINYLQNNPSPEDQRSYNLAYDDLGIMRVGLEYAYLPLASPEPIASQFNMTTDLFAQEARILAKMNIQTGDVEEIIGRLSPIFTEDKDVRLFSFFSFDLIENEKIAVTYRPDPLIYVFDNNFELSYTFGSEGKNMNLGYQAFPSTNNIPILAQHWVNETENRGYYTHLEYIEKRNFFFRSYQKGGDEDSDGLQIYRGQTLIADIDVPKKLKVIGYIEPYFFTNSFIDENGENITVYRFKIDD